MAAVLDRESVTVRPTGEALGADIEASTSPASFPPTSWTRSEKSG